LLVCWGGGQIHNAMHVGIISCCVLGCSKYIKHLLGHTQVSMQQLGLLVCWGGGQIHNAMHVGIISCCVLVCSKYIKHLLGNTQVSMQQLGLLISRSSLPPAASCKLNVLCLHVHLACDSCSCLRAGVAGGTHSAMHVSAVSCCIRVHSKYFKLLLSYAWLLETPCSTWLRACSVLCRPRCKAC
jgi:hypothetical protein